MIPKNLHTNDPEFLEDLLKRYPAVHNAVLNTDTNIFYFRAVDVSNYYTNFFHYSDILQNCDKVILENSHEAPYYSAWDSIAKRLIAEFNFQKKDILVIDGGEVQDNIRKQLNFLHETIIDPMILDIHLLKIPAKYIACDIEKNKTFVSLVRLPKLYRALFTQELLKRKLSNRHTIISCGVAQESDDSHIYKLLDDKYVKFFPITPFGKIPLDNMAQIHSDIRDYEECVKALVNVVVENSYENETVAIKGQLLHINNAWNRNFITEKTGKAFIQMQLPIFVATQGYVSYIRKLGFDVFDDIIDHSYDNVLSPYYRLQSIADEVERIHRLCLESGETDYRNLVHNFQERTQKNFLHMLLLKYQSNQKFPKILADFITVNK